MTARPTSSPLHQRLRIVYSRVRRALALRHALRAAAVAVVLLAFAVTAGLALPRTPGFASARLALVIIGSLGALAVALAGARRETQGWDAWLESLEVRFTGLRSWLRNALDLESAPAPATVTSHELADAVHAETSRRLAETPLEETVPALRPRTPLVATTAAVLSLVASVALAPQATLDAWRTLWQPAIAAPAVTLSVEPGDVTLVPGASLAVRARVEGSLAVPRLTGNGPSPDAVLESGADGAKRWRFDLPPVTKARTYAVRVGAVVSPDYQISLTGEPRALSFSSSITAPSYARLPAQAVSGTRGDLAALAGSRAAVEVTFDRDLESLSASVRGGAATAWSALTPRRWRGTVLVDGDGEWELFARGTTGEGRFRYRLTAIPDAPPVLTVALPEGDVDLPTGQQVPFDVLAQDDLGVSELRLEWRKTADEPWHEMGLARFGEEPREARATSRWDASPLALLPGESGVFRFVALDNARPGPRGRATSSEFRVRFPSLTDLYASLEERQENVSKALERAADQARELQKSLDKLQRQPQTQGRQEPTFERAEEMKKAASRQQAVAEQVQEAAREMRESLEQAAERQAFQEQLQRKLKEMTELLQQIQSQEFKEALKRMQEALQKMDRRQMEESLPQMREQNKDMLEQLDRSMELLKQLREEERMEALARRADDLRQRQDELNREHAEQSGEPKPSESQSPESKDTKESENSKRQGESPKGDRDLGERQAKAAEETRDLSKDAREAAKSSEMRDAQARMEDASKELEQNAAREQDSASQQSQEGDSQGAESSGKKASQSLSRASQSLSASARQQQEEQDARQLAAIRRASQDLVSLSRAAQDNLEGDRSAAQASEAQTDLSEGVARVADSLSALSQQTPFLSSKISAALGRAMENLSQSGREMSQGGRERGERSGRSATSSLNEAVKELRSAEAAMCNQPGAGTGGRKTTQRLGEVGRQQNQLNKQSREIARKLSRQMSMTQGDEAEMRRLADEQRRIREQLAEVRRDEEAKKSLLGRLDQAERDMQQAEEAIRQGQMDGELEQKQTQILSRLLDAQRSVHRRDFDPQREARRGEDVAHPSPGALPRELFRENDRLRQDLLKADADRVPARYRSLIEAYLRAMNGASR